MGRWKRYHGGTGRLYDEGEYKAGKETGVWRVYDKKGKLVRARKF